VRSRFSLGAERGWFSPSLNFLECVNEIGHRFANEVSIANRCLLPSRRP
jgi:hypothetical protein